MKTRIAAGSSLLLAILAMASLSPSQEPKAASGAAPAVAGGGVPPVSDRPKLDLLKWAGANPKTGFAVGQQPYGIAFDGANMWVANFGSNTVSKLRVKDGATLSTIKVGTQPLGVTFDGSNVWVTSQVELSRF